jgi:hypothetical protein
MTSIETFAPVPFLAELREEVLQHSLKRMPKWKFRLSADVVLQLQPKPTFLPSAKAIERGIKPRRIQFEGKAVKADSGATGAMLQKLPIGSGSNWWQLKFEIFAYDEPEWLLQLRGGCWKHLAGREGCETLGSDILAVFRSGFFDQLSPQAMLSPHCLICGKGLTDPASMARWIGPECAGTSTLRVPFVIGAEGKLFARVS